MRHPALLAVAGLFGLLGFSACTANVFTPPAHIAELQSPKVLDRGATKTVLSGGANSGSFQTLLVQGAGVVRRGLGRDLEASAGLNATWFDKQEVEADYSPWMGAAHAGIKWNPAGLDEFALTGSLGAGHAAGGEFVSAETGVLMGIEHGFLVPYLGASLLANMPFHTRPLALRDGSDEPITDEAELTTGAKGFLGCRLPLAHPSRAAGAPSLLVEGHYAWLRDDDEENPYMGGFLGLEIPFGH